MKDNKFMLAWLFGAITGFLFVATVSMIRIVDLAEKVVDLHFSNHVELVQPINN